MIAVIFEVQPAEGKLEEYLAIATELRSMLEEIEGFVSVERFQSLTHSGNFLSLSFFQDENSVARWRALAEHRSAQSSGRKGLFENYRIRVAHVVRDYGLHDRNDAPTDSVEALK